MKKVLFLSLIPVLLMVFLVCSGCSPGPDVVADVWKNRAVLITNEVLIDFGQEDDVLIRGDAWAEPEEKAESGESFAWALGQRAELEVTLAGGGPLFFGFRCWPYQWEGAGPQSVKVEINGRALGDVELALKAQIYSMVIPPEAVWSGSNRIVLSFAHAMAPAEVDSPFVDNRRLAAAFDWIAVSRQAFVDSKPAVRVVQDPVETDDGFVTEPGTALVYALEVPKPALLSCVLDADHAVEAAVWVQTPGGEPVEVKSFDVSGKISINLEEFSGESIDLIFANRGGAESGRLYWKQPLLNGMALLVIDYSNIVLIVADTLRADVLGCYGGEAFTPNIDALAASGVLFEHAYSHIPITGPSHSSLFTSLLPSEHGVLNNTQILDEDFVTIAEILRTRGFQTAAFTSLGVLNRRFGLAQGFETYVDDFEGDWMRTAEELNAMAMPWIEAYQQGSYFMMMHYSDPHEPYTPPGIAYPQVRLQDGEETLSVIEANGREVSIELELSPGTHLFRMTSETKLKRSLRFQHMRVEEPGFDIDFVDGWKIKEMRFGSARYDTLLPVSIEITNHGADTEVVHLAFACKENLKENDIREYYRLEVEYLDEHIGHLLDTLRARGMLQDTLVVFVADHGEGLGDHDLLGHCSQLYDTLIRIPLILSRPGRIEAGLRIDSAVGLVDFLPTVNDLLGIGTLPGLSGQSLLPLVDGGLRDTPVFSETFRPESASDKRAVILDGYKYIHSTKDHEWEELYFVKSDPGELENVRDWKPGRLKELRELVDQRLRSKTLTDADHAKLSDEDKARLEALGYLH